MDIERMSRLLPPVKRTRDQRIILYIRVFVEIWIGCSWDFRRRLSVGDLVIYHFAILVVLVPRTKIIPSLVEAALGLGSLFVHIIIPLT